MKDAKQELRAVMRSRRKALKEADPDASVRAAAHVPAVLESLSFTPLVVALYQPVGSEMDTAPLAQAFLAAGLLLALPRVAELEAPLVFHSWSPGEPLEGDLQRCAAPPAGAAVADPDIVIVPLLAFDRFGGRLGQGGGYYDRTLEQLTYRQPRAAFIGLAFAGQEVDRLPMERHDQKLDGVLTEGGYMPAKEDN